MRNSGRSALPALGSATRSFCRSGLGRCGRPIWSVVICGLAAFFSVSEAFVTPVGLSKGRGPLASLRDTGRRNICGLSMQEQKAEAEEEAAASIEKSLGGAVRSGRIGSLGSTGSLGGTKSLRRRAQSKTFTLTDLRTDDNLSVSAGSELLRTARGSWVDDIISTGRSRVLSRISERLGFTAIWSAYIATVFTISPQEWGVTEAFRVPGWPHELVGGFLAILLVFRTDQAYQRFWEGRSKWSNAAGQCKALARLAVSNLEGEHLDIVLSHICAFPVTLKQHLRGQRNVRELENIFASFGSGSSNSLATRIAGGNSMPLMCLTSLSMSIRQLRLMKQMHDNDHGESEDLRLQRHASYGREASLELWGRMEDVITQLSTVVAECEQIKCTPIPLSYSRHTSRFFTLFSVTLPFALIESTNPVLVPLITTGISWILFATEEIGHVIEEPFGQGLDDENEPPIFDEDLVRDVFCFFDEDESGSIDKTEFFLAMQKLGINTRAEDVDRLVAEIDENGNEMIEYDEFQTLLQRAKQESADLKVKKKTISGSLGYALVQSIEGFYMVVSMVFGVEKNMVKAENKLSTRQLEVLPLGRYCDQIQRDVLQQAVLTAEQEEQERYISMVASVGSAETGKRIVEILS